MAEESLPPAEKFTDVDLRTAWTSGASAERAQLRERVKERRQTLDMRPPLAKDGYLLALDDVMSMLAEPGEPQT